MTFNLLTRRLAALLLFSSLAAAPSCAFAGTVVHLGSWDSYLFYLSNGYGGTQGADGSDLTRTSSDLIIGLHKALAPLDDYGTHAAEEPGTLRTKAWLSGRDDATSWLTGPVGRWLGVTSTAGYSDKLTLVGVPGGGSFRLVLDYAAKYDSSGGGAANGRVLVQSGSMKALDRYQIQSGTNEYVSAPIAFAEGMPVDLGVFTESHVDLVNPTGNVLYGTALADASHTLTVRGIEVFDTSGKPLTSVTVTSSSGFLYRPVPVPEPASLAALVVGIGVLLRRRGGGR